MPRNKPTTNSRDKCKNCVHFTGPRSMKCTAELPFWAETDSNPTVYSEDGHGCPVFTDKDALE
jgi:hypothetical protein